MAGTKLQSRDEKKPVSFRREIEDYRNLFDSILFGVQEIDTKGTIIYANAAHHEIHGYESGELIGKSMLDLSPTQSARDELAAYLNFLLREQPDPTPWTGTDRRKDGSLVDVKIDWNYKRDQDGRIVGFISLITDVTEKNRLRKKLKESEEKYSKLFNNAIDAIIIVDVQTQNVIDVNAAFLKLYGYTRSEALQLKAEAISAEPQKTISTIKQTGREGALNIRRRIHKTKDGTKIVVDIAAATFMLQGRKVIFSRIQDITAHVRAEKELRQLEKQYRIAFRTSPDAININKMDGTYVDINEGFTHLTGYTRNDVIGRSSLNINVWNNPDDRKILMEKLLKNRHVQNFKADFRMKDGSIKTGLMSVNLFQLNNEPHILAITRDITDRKKAEEEKAKLEAQLRQVYKMEAIGTMAGGIAHDFNNILTIIVGNADLARYIMKVDGPARQYVDKILEASGRAKEMVRQILAFSRQAKQNLVPVKPHMVFNETLTLLRATIPSTVDIQQDISPQCHTIKADPTQLNQVLMNLCANAIQAMDEKGVLKISLQEVELGKKATRHKDNILPGPYVLLSVADTGKGISAKVKDRIFDPFFTTKKVGEGTGMGLAVVHGIVENHGGMITVASKPDKGTTFNVYFPVVKEAALVLQEMRSLQYKGDERILFIDDEKDLVDMATEMLQMYGYTVTPITSSTEALEAFNAAPGNFDLVVTDQTMPIISGTELSQELLKTRPDIPIILCTGYSSKISAEVAAKLGIADYFLKPFDTEKLLRSVRKVLDSRKQ